MESNRRAALAIVALLVIWFAVRAEHSATPCRLQTSPLVVPIVKRDSLLNGLQLITLEQPGTGSVSAHLRINSGSLFDLAGKGGLADLTAGMLLRGAGGLTARNMADSVEQLGLTVKVTAGWDSTDIVISGPADSLDSIFDLLGRLLITPSFDQKELDALKAMFAAVQTGPDQTIAAAEELLTKFADTDFKDTALHFEAEAYQQKNDMDKAQIYAERVLEVNPKHFQAQLMLAEILAQRTREMDLDREEKLVKADKYADETVNILKTMPKPNPQLTDEQWEELKKQSVARAHSAKGLAALTRKKFDVAVTEFKSAADNDPQPTYLVREASALESAGKHDEAIAICDKVLADAQLHPQIKQVAQSIKAQAAKASGKK